MTTVTDEVPLTTQSTDNANEENDNKPNVANDDHNNTISNCSEFLNEKEDDDDEENYYCRTCKNDNFNDYAEFLEHLKSKHIREPSVILQRVDDPALQKKKRTRKCGPLRFTVRTKDNHFEIVNKEEPQLPRVPKLKILLPEQLEKTANIIAASTLAQKRLECNNSVSAVTDSAEMVQLQTLPNELQSPSFPGESPAQPEVAATGIDSSSYWNEPTEDPLHLTESGEKEAETHNTLLENFLNDTAALDTNPKDTNLNLNDTEYISLDRLAGPQCPVCEERCLDKAALHIHQKALGHYGSNIMPYNSTSASSFDSLTNLPMQQLAQQVNRLHHQQQQVHQQNVLINIQQFGQPMSAPALPPPYGPGSHGMMPPRPLAPPPPPYSMPQHYGPQPPPSHMYNMYSHHAPPPPTSHSMYYNSPMYSSPMQHHNQDLALHHQPYQQQQRSSMIPEQQPPPPPSLQSRLPPSSMRQPLENNNTQSRFRPRFIGQRPPLTSRPSGAPPRPSNPPAPRPGALQPPRLIRRPGPNEPAPPLKRKRLDILIPDTNDNDDCHVISMQKCNDGWPIIKNVQGAINGDSGAAANQAPDSVMRLTDSITLSVRNPRDGQSNEQKKNSAKSVANILATRGITVTSTAKNQKPQSTGSGSNNKTTEQHAPPAPASVAINLNNAVSIIPAIRTGNTAPCPNTPTVDLTSDEPIKAAIKPGPQISKRTLNQQCDLCPAQYPTIQALMNHRRNYHKIGAQNEWGVPVVNLRQPAVLNKLTSIGVHHYIPLPQLSSGTATFALPILSVQNASNPSLCNIRAIGSNAVLPLGPLREIPNSK